MKAYSEPSEPSSSIVILGILSELSFDSILGPLATIAQQYYRGMLRAEDLGYKRVYDYRLRQFDRAVDGMEEIVYNDLPFFGGPKAQNA